MLLMWNLSALCDIKVWVPVHMQRRNPSYSRILHRQKKKSCYFQREIPVPIFSHKYSRGLWHINLNNCHCIFVNFPFSPLVEGDGPSFNHSFCQDYALSAFLLLPSYFSRRTVWPLIWTHLNLLPLPHLIEKWFGTGWKSEKFMSPMRPLTTDNRSLRWTKSNIVQTINYSTAYLMNSYQV